MSEKKETTYLDELNEIQKQAVTTTEGPVLVIAGPGSGKTRVLTYRIAHLINKGVEPQQILALTFTNKAAREMKERIVKVVGKTGNRVWGGTFHSLFARILRKEAKKIGYPSNFTIYDTDDSKSVIRTIIAEMGLSTEQYKANLIYSRISKQKSDLVTPRLYEEREDLIIEDKKRQLLYFYKIYAEYTRRCKRAGAMDFDDLLYRFFELLQKEPEVLQKYRDKFQYLLVDEFQDTNHLQYRIIKKLINYEGSKRNICVVGDDAQSIYGFRGATIKNIFDFKANFEAFGIKVFKLEQNYRSTEHIVKAANEVIAKNHNQIPKTIKSEKGKGNKIRVVQAMTDSEEGRRVADLIVEQKNRWHLKNSEIAILYRTNAQSRILEEALRRYNILYRVFGGISFYQRKEIKDMLAYLRLAVNPKDEEALRRVFNFPKRGLGKTTLNMISTFAAKEGKTIWEVLSLVALPGAKKNKILDFVTLIKSFVNKAATSNAYSAAEYIGANSGLHKLLEKDISVEGANRFENFKSLLNGIKEFVDMGSEEAEIQDGSLAAYLQNIALMTDLDAQTTDNEFVTLMTIHSAKGLEFPSVFVVGLEDDLFPSAMAKKIVGGLDEERRLFYVAITRAEAFLTLTCARSRYKFGKMKHNISPSSFFGDISSDNLEGDVIVSLAYAKSDLAKKESASVSGNFNMSKPSLSLDIDLENFKPSNPDKIQTGMNVLHSRFGNGKVLSIDGIGENRLATIYFRDYENSQKKIFLRFAKLQII